MEKPHLKSTLALALLALSASSSASAGTVTWNAGNILGGGINEITSANASAVGSGWTGNATLNYNAWGMQGNFASFQVTAGTDVVISADSAINLPSFTLYSTINANIYTLNGPPFAANTANSGAVHSFNQVGQVGADGIRWANGVLETLGYVNSATADHTNAFGGQVLRGAHDISIDNLFEQGIAGSVWSDASGNHATMTIHNLAAGFYNIFIGGAQYSSNAIKDAAGNIITPAVSATNNPISLSVKAVPIPAAVWLFGSGLIGLFGASRKKLSA